MSYNIITVCVLYRYRYMYIYIYILCIQFHAMISRADFGQAGGADLARSRRAPPPPPRFVGIFRGTPLGGLLVSL